jgi:hypothetical protein
MQRMESTCSSNLQPAGMDALPGTERRQLPYHGLPVPAEASTVPRDSQDFYAEFFEKVSCALHKDGKNVIICWPKEPPGVVPDPRSSEGWPVTKIRKAYERLGEEHPRVVRCAQH